MLIGLSGRKRSGKSTSATLLVSELGFKQAAFADKLKELTANFLGVPFEEVLKDRFKRENILATLLQTPDDFAKLDWCTGRDVFQRLGTDACRKTFGDDFWIERLFAGLPACDHPFLDEGFPSCGHLMFDSAGDRVRCARAIDDHANVVITDVRFANEVAAIVNAGGQVVRLNRADTADTRHGYKFAPSPEEESGFCCYELPDRQLCELPKAAHPSHYSGDTHQSETSLPDMSNEWIKYAAVFESGSGEEQAANVLAWVKTRLQSQETTR